MRLVLDLQACQTTGSRFRGIGRYSSALAMAMLRRAQNHDCWIALNGAFADSVEAIKRDFAGLIPEDHIRVWNVSGPVSAGGPSTAWRRRVTEVVRETCLYDLKPDFVHMSSLFEGLGDDAVTSIGGSKLSPPTAVTLFDLIPLINQEVYLSNPVVREWYFDKLDSLRKARLLLAISESSRQEAIQHLKMPADRVINISSAADPMFRRISVAHGMSESLRNKFRLVRPFVMYTGGIDHRKNIEGLIRSFAMLPREMRDSHQLAIVCNVHEADRTRLQKLAAECGLKADDLVMTGFVSDDELVALCNLCKLFVFPSWHEGFGLPALEAMACGASVIAANSSSLPEVIGREDALFDPLKDEAITAAMRHALASDDFRAELSRHGVERAKLFSWDETARRALQAMEEEVDSRADVVQVALPVVKPRLAYVSPMPPQRSGVANYSAKLLPFLANHYNIEVISDEPVGPEASPANGFPRRSTAWFLSNARDFDRVVYQFGNSAFHEQMFDMLRTVPGTVVLHDFYLGHLQRHREFVDSSSLSWWRALYESHGYAAMKERQNGVDGDLLATKYPCNLRVLADADGVIVHSQFGHNLIQQWYGQRLLAKVRHIPHLHETVAASSKKAARDRLRLSADAFVVASFGFITPLKLAHRLLSAWKLAGLAEEANCVLVLAGECQDPQYASRLDKILSGSAAAKRGLIIKTGYQQPDQYRDLLASVDVAVQLRTDSRGETSGATLDCLAFGIPTIINAHGANAELRENVVLKLPDDFSDEQLASALLSVKHDPELRHRLGLAAQACIKEEHAPDHVASLYHDAIEAFFVSSPRQRLSEMADVVAEATAGMDVSDEQLIESAREMAKVRPLRHYQRQWLIDVSELVTTDAKSGIQRVVRSVLSQLLSLRPDGVRIEPVYSDGHGAYRYARRFTAGFLQLPVVPGHDSIVETSSGDMFLGLDLCPHIIPKMIDYFRSLRAAGVEVQFVLYDLLPAMQPQWFPPKLSAFLQEWYAAIAQVSDRVIAISKSVAEEYYGWLEQHHPVRQGELMLGSFHLGADIESSVPTSGVESATCDLIRDFSGRPALLTVGTVEPRKGHAQALDAFEVLWARGSDAALVLVGKRGWHVESLVERLETHPELNKKLFWFEGVSDETLELIYKQASLLLAASWGEGFGLPLVEAARRGMPVLARDLPVFREVAGNGATYFQADTAEDLAEAVESAVRKWRAGELPDPRQIRTLTWEQSTSQFLQAIKGGNDHYAWALSSSPASEMEYGSGSLEVLVESGDERKG